MCESLHKAKMFNINAKTLWTIKEVYPLCVQHRTKSRYELHTINQTDKIN